MTNPADTGKQIAVFLPGDRSPSDPPVAAEPANNKPPKRFSFRFVLGTGIFFLAIGLLVGIMSTHKTYSKGYKVGYDEGLAGASESASAAAIAAEKNAPAAVAPGAAQTDRSVAPANGEVPDSVPLAGPAKKVWTCDNKGADAKFLNPNKKTGERWQLVCDGVHWDCDPVIGDVKPSDCR